MTAKELFERADLAEHRLNAAKRKLELFESLAERVTSSIGGEQVTHTRDVTSNETAYIRLIEANNLVLQLKSEYQAITGEISDTLSLLANIHLRRSLCLRPRSRRFAKPAPPLPFPSQFFCRTLFTTRPKYDIVSNVAGH